MAIGEHQHQHQHQQQHREQQQERTMMNMIKTQCYNSYPTPVSRKEEDMERGMKLIRSPLVDTMTMMPPSPVLEHQPQSHQQGLTLFVPTPATSNSCGLKRKQRQEEDQYWGNASRDDLTFDQDEADLILSTFGCAASGAAPPCSKRPRRQDVENPKRRLGRHRHVHFSTLPPDVQYCIKPLSETTNYERSELWYQAEELLRIKLEAKECGKIAWEEERLRLKQLELEQHLSSETASQEKQQQQQQQRNEQKKVRNNNSDKTTQSSPSSSSTTRGLEHLSNRPQGLERQRRRKHCIALVLQYQSQQQRQQQQQQQQCCLNNDNVENLALLYSESCKFATLFSIQIAAQDAVAASDILLENLFHYYNDSFWMSLDPLPLPSSTLNNETTKEEEEEGDCCSFTNEEWEPLEYMLYNIDNNNEEEEKKDEEEGTNKNAREGALSSASTSTTSIIEFDASTIMPISIFC